MKRRRNVLEKLLMLFICIGCLPAYGQLDDPHWRATDTFRDDFNDTSISQIDRSKWKTYLYQNTADLISGYCDSSKIELYHAYQEYDFDTSVYKMNGSYITLQAKPMTRQLRWLARWIDLPNGKSVDSGFNHPFNYHSGNLVTKNEFLYGYFAWRARYPGRDKSNPAEANKYRGLGTKFWLFGSNENAPYLNNHSELDPYEYNATDDFFWTSMVHRYVSEGKNGPKWFTHRRVDFSPTDINQWHTYAMEWSPNIVIYYMDGKEIFNTTNERVKSLSAMSVLMEIACPWNDPAGCTTAGAQFPFNYDIDYFFVRKMQCDVNNVFTANNYFPELTNYDNKVKKEINIGPAVVPSTGNVYLRAKDGITINPGFEVQPGATFFMSVSGCAN